MSEKEKKILDTFGKIIPDLSDVEKEKLLSFGEGMAFKVEQEKKGENGHGSNDDSGNRASD